MVLAESRIGRGGTGRGLSTKIDEMCFTVYIILVVTFPDQKMKVSKSIFACIRRGVADRRIGRGGSVLYSKINDMPFNGSYFLVATFHRPKTKNIMVKIRFKLMFLLV